jgi:hypothetical protein
VWKRLYAAMPMGLVSYTDTKNESRAMRIERLVGILEKESSECALESSTSDRKYDPS